MDRDTLIILVLLAAALCWWCAMHIKEERQVMRQSAKERAERRERAERMRRLSHKSIDKL